jgi:alkylation response protein AidB-like acyl-CoA dehydrogenase
VVDTAQIQERVHEVAAEFARQRGNRQLRRELLPEDFERLKDAGFLLSGVPVELGGIWEDGARSTRPVCELLRTLAHGDSSVALVCAMHPAVLSFWLSTPQAPPPFRDAWAQQRRQVCEAARDGAWWGTITSEPGSGGDVANTRAVARSSAEDSRGGQGAAGAAYRLSGQKHFGSGAGITSYMLTSAVPAGESEPDWFYLDVRGVPWDGSTGMELLAPWDGHGMIATQSHAFRFEAFPASRFAWPGAWRAIQGAAAPVVGCCFTAVIVGIAETAMEAARQQLERRRSSLRPYEQVEWSQAQLEGWLIQQAYEGMLRAVESGHDPAAGARSVLLGKTAIATLAERAMGRLCRVLGGGTYARTSPVGAWFEDVRALGFLRPPWGLAYDRLFESSWEA